MSVTTPSLALFSQALCSSSANTVDDFNRQCLSCDLVENCTYFSASFSHSMDYFLLKCEGEWLPPHTCLGWMLRSAGRGTDRTKWM